MYVMSVDGNMMRQKDIRKAVLHMEQNEKTFQKILNVRYVESEKTSSQKQNKTAVL